MNHIITTIILSILPVIELRGAIPYAILNGINPIVAFLIAIFSNMIVIFIGFFFLDYFHDKLLTFSKYKMFFEYYINKKIKKIKNNNLSFFVLFLLVLTPLPGTGAYTGTLLSWFFKLNRTKSFITIILGVIFAGIIVTLLTIGGIKFF